MTAKLLVTIATLIYGVAPMFADLNSTHVFHPEWTLTDMGGIEINFPGREGNVIAFGFVVVLLSVGLLMRTRTDDV